MGITILLNHLHLQEFKRNLPGAAAPRRKTGRVGAARYTDQACCSVGSDLHHRELGKTSWSQGVTRQIGWLNGEDSNLIPFTKKDSLDLLTNKNQLLGDSPPIQKLLFFQREHHPNNRWAMSTISENIRSHQPVNGSL